LRFRATLRFGGIVELTLELEKGGRAFDYSDRGALRVMLGASDGEDRVKRFPELEVGLVGLE